MLKFCHHRHNMTLDTRIPPFFLCIQCSKVKSFILSILESFKIFWPIFSSTTDKKIKGRLCKYTEGSRMKQKLNKENKFFKSVQSVHVHGEKTVS